MLCTSLKRTIQEVDENDAAVEEKMKGIGHSNSNAARQCAQPPEAKQDKGVQHVRALGF